MVIHKQLKHISNYQYIHGDFDKDNIKNIDDPKPFNPKVKYYPKHTTHGKFYHKARYGEGEREVLLSDELRQIENYNSKEGSFVREVIRENPHANGRIKTVPSTIRKLRMRYMHPRQLTPNEKRRNEVGLYDIAAVSILTKDRKEAYKVANKLKKKYKVDPHQTDDYYKHPKDNVHYGIHLGIIQKKTGARMEVQIKSRPMHYLSKKMHHHYKRNKPLHKFIKPAKHLYNRGF